MSSTIISVGTTPVPITILNSYAKYIEISECDPRDDNYLISLAATPDTFTTMLAGTKVALVMGTNGWTSNTVAFIKLLSGTRDFIQCEYIQKYLSSPFPFMAVAAGLGNKTYLSAIDGGTY